MYLHHNTKHWERSYFDIPIIYNQHTSQIQRALKGKQESNKIRWRDEVKWILLCLQGQSNNSSSHRSWRWCPCVTVCAAVSQVRCDLKTEEKEVTDAGNKGGAGIKEKARSWSMRKRGKWWAKQSERGKMNEQKGFEDHKDLDTPEARIPALTHCQNGDKRHTHSQASTQITGYPKYSGNHLHKVLYIKQVLYVVCAVSHTDFARLASRRARQWASQENTG